MRCLLCGDEGEVFVDKEEGVEYLSCARCGTIAKQRGHFMNLEEQKKRYDLHNNSEENSNYRAYFEGIVSFFLPHLEGVREALDFGCGASRLLSIILGEHGIACDSYDPIYHPQTPYEQKRYDAIISIEVFEHLHDPIATLKRLIDSLNPNGYLIIGTALLPQTHEEFLQWRYRIDPTHVVFYSLQSFELLANQFRLDIVAHNGKNLVILRVR